MRALVQRVTEARVRVEGDVIGEIGPGLCVLVGVTHDDTEDAARKLAEKVWHLRVFDDADGVMNLPLERDRRRRPRREPVHPLRRHPARPAPVVGRRRAPEQAEGLVDEFAQHLRDLGAPVATGQFAARMQVELINDGPVTLLIET